MTAVGTADAAALLRARLGEFQALVKAADLLEWDHEVMMPRAGGEARASQIAAVEKAAHSLLVAPEVGEWLEALGPAAGEGDGDEAALARWARRERRRRVGQPADFVGELARHVARSQEVWVEARRRSDFALFRPALEKMLELKRRQAELVGAFADPYDAWLEGFEPGMTTARVSELFAELKAGLVPLVRDVAGKAASLRVPEPRGPFPVARQRELGLEAARAMGFDFSRGRLDESAHPFSSGIAPGDVRLTTRYREDLPFSALFGVMHEAGHGLYEQNVAPELEGTPLAAGATMALHESQSRLWENQVGRGREWWAFLAPRFRALFPESGGLSAGELHRAANRVELSHIRVEADELTYSLHVMLRFDLERALLSGDLKAADLPAAWAAKSQELLGIVPPDDARGVLQDTHWASGLFGYFPTYAVGNMISAQLWEAALKAEPGIPEALSRGDGAPLLGWLRENVHRHGRKYGAEELVRRACGGPISPKPYLDYLRAKFGALYGL
ncbi:MAG: carboxypeptidase M32 [Elusimicrobia bacterium]|nr:carboxypeptidase M32 [Elusimicrobiota bacterium]